MGISEGGYGAIRFAGNRPDRFAATGGMAAAEPIATSPPENMRNVAMRIDIGERDTMFDRVGLARRMGERLAELHEQDPDGYDFAVNIQKGRGHGIDYSPTAPWLAARVRDPRPGRVVWIVKKFDSSVALRSYWLALDAPPATLPLHLDVRIDGNRIAVEHDATESVKLRLRLDDRLVRLDDPVVVVVNGLAREPVMPSRELAVMLRTLAERADANWCFPAELAVELTVAKKR